MEATAPPPDPSVPGTRLFRYQRTWVEDDARWKFGLMARQVGKDFASGFEGIRQCVEADLHGRRVDWLIAAPSERQSLESLEKWKMWAEAFKVAIDDEKITREGGPETLLKSAQITFPHGSRVFAVPGKPDTVRGFSANVLLTEFAFFEQPEATWRAILPSLTNSLRGGVKKVRLITTPNGIGNKAHDLWIRNYKPGRAERPADSGQPDNLFTLPLRPNNASDTPLATTVEPPEPSLTQGPQWSCHLIDIHTAVRDGLPADIAELKAALDDPEGWAQEFECQFLDAQAVLLPYELLAACESPEATTAVAPEFWESAPTMPLFLGIDFGRRHDLTVAWTLKQVGDVQQTVEVLELERTSTPEQVERLRPRLRQARRVCLDYTGPGIGLGDYLAKEYGEWDPPRHKFGKIELCNFTSALKLEIFSKLRMAFEKHALRIPVNRLIREDLHSINRVSSASGQISYRASHSADGHADRCTALALALRAVGDAPVRSSLQSVPLRPRATRPGSSNSDSHRWTL